MRTRRVAGLAAILLLGAAVPASAQVMPLAGSTRPPRTEPAGNAVQDGADRDAAFVIGGLGRAGDGMLAIDLQLGWMVTPWLGVLASLGGYWGTDTDTSLRGVGVRLASGPVFVEGQIVSKRVSSDCDFDNPCVARTSHAGVVGAGVELLHLRHFAFEVHARVLADGRTSLLLGGLGLGFYY
jgi:hypothetical protein